MTPYKVMVMFITTILKFYDQKHIHSLGQKTMGLYQIIHENKFFYIIVFCTCYKINVY